MRRQLYPLPAPLPAAASSSQGHREAGWELKLEGGRAGISHGLHDRTINKPTCSKGPLGALPKIHVHTYCHRCKTPGGLLLAEPEDGPGRLLCFPVRLPPHNLFILKNYKQDSLSNQNIRSFIHSTMNTLQNRFICNGKTNPKPLQRWPLPALKTLQKGVPG